MTFLPWDFLCFVGLGLAVLLLLHGLVFRRISGFRRALSWLILVVLLVAGWLVADAAGRKEADNLRAMVAGFPPTYAQEISRLGHAKMKPDTSPSDPAYLAMIEAQKRWLKVNRQINDIYTLRVAQDRKVFFCVDSETDYDGNGRYEGDREARTSIYELDQEPDPAVFTAARDRKLAFSAAPYSDRWGRWISAYEPLFDERGNVEGVLGVDFDAANWDQAVLHARLSAYGYVAAIGIMLAGFAAVMSQRTQQMRHESRQRESQVQLVGKRKFETLVNTIQGVVWERDLQTLDFIFLSDQLASQFGIDRSSWLATPSGWWEMLHPASRETVERQLRAAAAAPGHYQMEYQLLLPGDRVQWISESGTHVPAGPGGPAALRGVMRDITARMKALMELEETQKQLIESSRKVGMAEVASGVLHNVGNVLNSINVSSTLIHETVRKSRVSSLQKLAEMLSANRDALGQFFTHDPRGLKVPDFLQQLTTHLAQEQATLTTEIESLVRNVEHIKDIIVTQQDYARVAGRMEPLNLQDVVQDALELSNTSFHRHSITVKREFDAVPRVLGDRHKLLQILINLIRNAKHALEESRAENRQLLITMRLEESGMVRLAVADNGIGIAPENLTRIFSHGFTTKSDGHGFGLHSSAIAAREMGGSLNAHSDGPGRGAAFILDLPAMQPAPEDSRPLESSASPALAA